MNIIYLFCESGVTRIPFFEYDPPLFRRIAALGGKWDKVRNEFHIEGNIPAAQLSRDFPGIPFVRVDAASPVPIQVSGFFERPWQGAAGGQRPLNDSKPAPAKPGQPEKFPEHWRIKLETELRSRKYSPKTVGAYIYFNRMLCRTLQKLPEEIQQDDITQFLAETEKDKDYSASSMNLAISALK